MQLYRFAKLKNSGLLIFVLISLFFVFLAFPASAADCKRAQQKFSLSSSLKPFLSFAEKTINSFGYNVSLAAAPDPDPCGSSDSVACSGSNSTATMTWQGAPQLVPGQGNLGYYCVSINDSSVGEPLGKCPDSCSGFPFSGLPFGLGCLYCGGFYENPWRYTAAPSCGNDLGPFFSPPPSCNLFGFCSPIAASGTAQNLIAGQTYNWYVGAWYLWIDDGLSGYPTGYYLWSQFGVPATFLAGSFTAANCATPSCPAAPNDFKASPSTINLGDNSTLSWGAVPNANSCNIDNGVGNVSCAGSTTPVSPNATKIYTLTATNTNSGASANCPTGISVNQPFNFSLSNTGNITIQQPVSGNNSGSNNITANLTSGVTQSVNFSAAGLPSGASGSFAPGSCSPDCSVAYTISVGPSVSVGSYPITVTGTGSSGLQKTTSFNLIVTNAVDFSLSASPGYRKIAQTNASGVNYTITVASLNDFNSPVGLSVSGCPAGATCSLPPSVTPPKNGSANTTLTVKTNSTPAGTYTLTIAGTSGLTHTAQVTLEVVNIAANFSAVPSSGTAPLTSTLTAEVTGGNAAGTINYKFDCNNDGTIDSPNDPNYIGTSDLIKTFDCVYPAGNHTAKVIIERDVAIPFSDTKNISVTAIILAPNTPTNFKALPGADCNHLILSWTDVSNEDHYEIDQSNDGGTTWFSLSTNWPADSTSFTVSSLSGSTSYDFRIKACNSAGCSSPSTASGTTSVCPVQATLVITPSSASIKIGEKTNLDAFYDSDGPTGPSPAINVTMSTDWSSNNPSIATVDNGSKKGEVTGKAIGSTQIKATYKGIDAFANIGVSFKPWWKEVIPW